MDTELRAFLEDRFGRLEGRMDRFEQRLEALEQRMGGFEQRLEVLEQCMGGFEQRLHEIERETSRLGVLLESMQQQVRLVAEGHGILYGAIDRQYEEVRAELRDVRALLKVWNELVTRRLTDLEYRMREKVS